MSEIKQYSSTRVSIDFNKQISYDDILDILTESAIRYQIRYPNLRVIAFPTHILIEPVSSCIIYIEPPLPENWKEVLMSQFGIDNVRFHYFCKPHG